MVITSQKKRLKEKLIRILISSYYSYIYMSYDSQIVCFNILLVLMNDSPSVKVNIPNITITDSVMGNSRNPVRLIFTPTKSNIAIRPYFK